MNDPLAFNLFVDGGVLGRNPSLHGGTYGWVLVNTQGKRVEYDSGVITPESVGKQKVTNNLSELFAALAALEYVLANWPGYQGCLWTDSIITCRRLTNSVRFNGIPRAMELRCLKLRRNRLWLPQHLGGHPNKKELALGYDSRGLPVSIHNVFVDKLCQNESARYFRRMGYEKAGVKGPS